MVMRLTTAAIAICAAFPAIGNAQVMIEPNCGVQAFPTGGCVTPTDDGNGGGFQGYAGVQFSFGGPQGITPKVVVGIRDTEVSSDGTITGADLAVRFAVAQTLTLDSAVLSGLRGDDDLLGGVGVGYSYTHGGWLIGASVERNVVRVGVDYAPGANAIEIYAEAVMRSEADEGVSCPAGFRQRDIDIDGPLFGGPQIDGLPSEGQPVVGPPLVVGRTTCEPLVYDGFVGQPG